jgi:hypothetical protein
MALWCVALCLPAVRELSPTGSGQVIVGYELFLFVTFYLTWIGIGIPLVLMNVALLVTGVMSILGVSSRWAAIVMLSATTFVVCAAITADAAVRAIGWTKGCTLQAGFAAWAGAMVLGSIAVWIPVKPRFTQA